MTEELLRLTHNKAILEATILVERIITKAEKENKAIITFTKGYLQACEDIICDLQLLKK